jgi:hypothetical protein
MVRLSLAHSLKDYYENRLINQKQFQEIVNILVKDKDLDVRNSIIRVINTLKSD